MSEMATVFGPEPVLDETRYGIILTRKDETDDAYSATACINELFLCRKGVALEEVYEQAVVVKADTKAVKAFVVEVFVKDQLAD